MRFPEFTVALLAGGKSTRMGCDKARLRGRDGRELWEDRLELLSGLGAEEALVSVREDQTALVPQNARMVVDQWSGLGPMGGIVSCLEAMETDFLLVLAVDLPAMNRAVLLALLEKASVSGRGVICCSAGFLEPLVAIYPKTMALSGRGHLQSGDLALRGWIEEAEEAGQLVVMEAPEDWSGCFLNVNDPTAWAEWMA